jgi:O-antigen ligase
LTGEFTQSSSINNRYKYILYIIENTNFLLGNGLGYISYNPNRPNIVDNYYFRVYAEIGILGFIIFILPILGMSIMTFRSLLKQKEDNKLILFYSTVGALLLMTTSNLLDNTSVIIIFYFILGSLLCMNAKNE